MNEEEKKSSGKLSIFSNGINLICHRTNATHTHTETDKPTHTGPCATANNVPFPFLFLSLAAVLPLLLLLCFSAAYETSRASLM